MTVLQAVIGIPLAVLFAYGVLWILDTLSVDRQSGPPSNPGAFRAGGGPRNYPLHQSDPRSVIARPKMGRPGGPPYDWRKLGWADPLSAPALDCRDMIVRRDRFTGEDLSMWDPVDLRRGRDGLTRIQRGPTS